MTPQTTFANGINPWAIYANDKGLRTSTYLDVSKIAVFNDKSVIVDLGGIVAMTSVFDKMEAGYSIEFDQKHTNNFRKYCNSWLRRNKKKLAIEKFTRRGYIKIVSV